MRAHVLCLILVACRPASTAPATNARIVFVAPTGSMWKWRFQVHGLPAVDMQTDEILVADAGDERIRAYDSVAVFALRPGASPRTVTLLVDSVANGELGVVEDEQQELLYRDGIAARVREQTRLANADLARRALRPLVACRLPPDAPLIFCTHPQRITCGEESFELEDDALRWRGGAVRTGWQIPPLDIGDGPPKKMLACIEEAHFDVATRQLAVRYHQVCEHGGSDACIERDAWRVLALRRGR